MVALAFALVERRGRLAGGTVGQKPRPALDGPTIGFLIARRRHPPTTRAATVVCTEATVMARAAAKS